MIKNKRSNVMVIRHAILLDDLQEVKNQHHGIMRRKGTHLCVPHTKIKRGCYLH